MTSRSDAIVLAEQQVIQARTAVSAEYDAARTRLRRRTRSPVFIGGVLLGAIALAYLAAGRGKPTRPFHRDRPNAWSRTVNTVQVLLPLLIALNAATKTSRAPDAASDGTDR